MGQRIRGIWPVVCSWENVFDAWRQCRKRKRYRKPATVFDDHAFDRLSNLVELLRAEKWQPGKYRHFRIVDPKPRIISAAPFEDRIVHHAVVRVLEPYYERSFIHDSYGCRKGKGTHRALRRAQRFLRSHNYVLKTDLVKFFPSVDHELFLRLLSRRITDPPLMRLIAKIISSGAAVPHEEDGPYWFPGDDLLAAQRDRGLPIGNLTSQFFANVFLNPVDHFVKEELRVTGYIRYADDMLLFGETKGALWQARDRLAERLADLRLRLHPDKTHVRPCSQGVRFLGMRVRADQLRISQQSLRRFHRRRRRLQGRFADGLIDCGDVAASLKAWLAWAGQANSSQITSVLLQKIRLQRNQSVQAGTSCK